ncbi:unnamed protein product [Clavelina lepadiformis]|uniref:Rap-GAP domain-containing protein n=1 Tax=Clavelina lepadiformis TaxID=159417 RepID=A0ABP0F7P6_CLALP
MYSEWPSIENEVLEKCRSVLHTYPSSVGRDVAKSVVNSLIATHPSLSMQPNGHRGGVEGTQTMQGLSTKEQVKWTMEVICFALSLTLSEYDTLDQSVSIYLDWLTVAVLPKANVPKPLLREPLPYIRQMIRHLENLFIPRTDGNTNNQLTLCKTVLRAVQSLAHESNKLDRTTWESLLMFVLNVSDTLLAPPSLPNSLAEQICEQLMQTFYDVWMVSCCRFFPTPSLWKTARILISKWRHHPPVVDWWSRITSALTSRLLSFTYGQSLPQYKIPDDDAKYIPKEMDNEVIAQAWFRVLHLISDPVELSNTNIITKTPMFMEYTLNSETMFDPLQHPCLRMLPYIFLKAIKGVSSLVDAFLGLTEQKRYEVSYNILMQIATPITPTTARKSGKAKKGTSSTSIPKPPPSPALSTVSSHSSTSPSTTSPSPHSLIDMRPHPASSRPQCNSILHLFGEWLFDAALAGCKFEKTSRKKSPSEAGGRTTSIPYSITSSTSTSVLSAASPGDNLVSNPMFDSSEFPESYEAGRAEACGTLCRLMCCKKTNELILPVYLSRFYLVLSQGLLGDSKQVLASILLNSVDLMRIDLPGVTCLLPALLSALETILPDKELQQFKPYLNTTELRRTAIHLLVSMLPLPLHFTTLQIEDVQDLWAATSASGGTLLTFQSLKKRLLDLLMGALQCEADPVNTQMILGALLLALHDSAIFEAAGDSADDGSASGKKTAGVVQPSENEIVSVDTAYGLFVQIIHVVSQKLDTWKSDVSISLAALELLGGLAKATVNMQDQHECRRAVQELCQYIIRQCERPPPQHKRELHTVIVTSFHTLATWLLQHPYLMNYKECLYEILEIIELGISGSKSKQVSASTNQSETILKSNKELNPVSMRVLEAAEGLLILVFEHVGAFPSPCSPGSTSSLLDEPSLLHHSSGGRFLSKSDEQSTSEHLMAKAVPHFRYFGLHNGLLLGILEQTLGNEQEPVPTVTVIVRSSSGRKVWTMQLRQTPRNDKLSPSSYLARPKRPDPISEPKKFERPRYRVFPEEVERIPPVKADQSIPLLRDVPNPEQAAQIEKLHHLIELHKRYDDVISQVVREDPESMSESVPMQSSHEFQTARLLLSHLNLLTLDAVKAQPQARMKPDLVMLNAGDSSFAYDLATLDSMSTRNHDTVFVFYLKSGQTGRDEILGNVSGDVGNLQPSFTEFLLSLGWPVDVDKHPGWTGRVSGSWKLKDQLYRSEGSAPIDLNHQPAGVFNGEKYILYYADATTEVAFIVPSQQNVCKESAESSCSGGADLKEDESLNAGKLTLDLNAAQTIGSSPVQESPTSPTLSSKPKKLSIGSRQNFQPVPDARVAVVWCENYDSFDNFALEALESDMSTEQESPNLQTKSKEPLVAIMIHPLSSGLFRIQVQGQGSSKGVAVPLVSGTVVSRRCLGMAVRMTTMNICQRRRLASDSYNPPHIRRKQRIHEFLSKYQRRCTEPEFFTAMFAESKPEENLNISCNGSSGSSSSLASMQSALKQTAMAS